MYVVSLSADVLLFFLPSPDYFMMLASIDIIGGDIPQLFVITSVVIVFDKSSNGGSLCRGYFSYEKWRAQRDSNPRPSVPKTDALSAEL